ncbi:MAG: PilZ domain-containing protein [Candidatus Acidiferrales bacterium]
MNGRFETRIFLTVPLYLHESHKTVAADLALTENVSAHGARVVTKRPGRPGEEWQIAALSGGIQLAARVVYCEALANHNFCVGLELGESAQNWWSVSRGIPGDAKTERACRQESNLPIRCSRTHRGPALGQRGSARFKVKQSDSPASVRIDSFSTSY